MLNQPRLSWSDILQSILLKNKAEGNHQGSVRVNNILFDKVFIRRLHAVTRHV